MVLGNTNGKVHLYRFNHFYHWRVCSANRTSGNEVVESLSAVPRTLDGEGEGKLINQYACFSSPVTSTTWSATHVRKRGNDRIGRNLRVVIQHAIVHNHASFTLCVWMKGVDYENTMSADQNVVANAKSPDG